jgi:hypothetical protein
MVISLGLNKIWQRSILFVKYVQTLLRMVDMARDTIVAEYVAVTYIEAVGHLIRSLGRLLPAQPTRQDGSLRSNLTGLTATGSRPIKKGQASCLPFLFKNAFGLN